MSCLGLEREGRPSEDVRRQRERRRKRQREARVAAAPPALTREQVVGEVQSGRVAWVNDVLRGMAQGGGR